MRPKDNKESTKKESEVGMDLAQLRNFKEEQIKCNELNEYNEQGGNEVGQEPGHGNQDEE